MMIFNGHFGQYKNTQVKRILKFKSTNRNITTREYRRKREVICRVMQLTRYYRCFGGWQRCYYSKLDSSGW